MFSPKKFGVKSEYKNSSKNKKYHMFMFGEK